MKEQELIFSDDKQEDELVGTISPQRKVYTQKSERSIYELSRYFQRGSLITRPSYQRMLVWDPIKCSSLVESVLLGVPIPVIYLNEEKDGKFSVIDGQQRLTALIGFLNNHYVEDGKTKEFRLRGLKVLEELNGKRYQDIPQNLQDKFETSTLLVVEIQKESDPEIKFNIFERLNTGAVQLNPQELRNCIYRGRYNDLLEESVEDKEFQTLLGLNSPHYRMYDRELVLRFFAFYHNTYLKYNPSMKRFLNMEMEIYQNLTEKHEKELLKIFKKSVNLSKIVFGTKAYRRFIDGGTRDPNGKWEINKINKALYDVVMFGFTLYEENQIIPFSDVIREELIHLMTNDPFKGAISTYTDNKIQIQTRFERWHSALKEIVGMPTSEPRTFSLDYKRQLWESSPVCAMCENRIHIVDDAEIDHVEQYWRGGKTVPSNARLVHRHCNRSRSKFDADNYKEDVIIDNINDAEDENSGERIRGGIPQKEYCLPILKAILNYEGGASRNQVHDFIEEKMSYRFNEIDNRKMKDRYTKRWQKNIDYQRLRMVKEGLLLSNSPQGIWEISEKGRRYYDLNKPVE